MKCSANIVVQLGKTFSVPRNRKSRIN